MFRAIKIENFRGIKHLELADLPRVNVFVGKNNIGKTAILEAISILSLNKVLGVNATDTRSDNLSFENTKALFGWVYKLSFDRNAEDFNRHYQQGRSSIELNREVIYPIIYGRGLGRFDGFSIRGRLADTAAWLETYWGEEVDLQKALQYSTHNSQAEKDIAQQQRINDFNSQSTSTNENEFIDTKVALEHTWEVFQYRRFSNRSGVGGPYPSGYNFNQDKILSERIYGNSSMQFVKVNSENTISNSLLYDKIVFDQQKMNFLIQGLNIIDPDIERFAYQGNEFGERSAKIKLRSVSTPVSITTMGDGISRVLAIILAIVNCQNGYLLIDELENGLHFSVQKQLWEIIFQLAEILNIQIFVTTHSDDTIRAFSSVLSNRNNNRMLGRAYRIQKKDDNIVAVEYSPEELQSSREFDIEIR